VGFGPLISSVTSPARSRLILTTEQNRLQLSSYIQFFGNSMAEKISVGKSCFLQGFLRIMVCSVMVKRGEFVVIRVVNVDRGRPLLWRLKTGHGFEVYF
jgi:hypothetical protein